MQSIFLSSADLFSAQKILHEHSTRVLFPRPPKVYLERALHWKEVWGGGHITVLNGNPCVLIGVVPALSGVKYLLILQGSPGEEIAILQNHGRVAEDEIYGAIDVAFSVELTKRMGVKGVLVPFEATAIEGR